MSQDDSAVAIRTIAFIEGAKGVLVLLAGCGLLTLIHRNLHRDAADLVRNLHLNPDGYYPHIFLDLANRVTAGELKLLASAALLYALIRFVEAYGLWRQQLWAEWFGVISCGIYLPFELYEVIFAFNWVKGLILAVNLGVFLILARTLRRKEPEDIAL
ncbi:MAG: DUF2127 domain-containing protein [Desulfuromonadales bacterium]|nr:DUF2127 domain-containing protein [Desulfuromonadales bacterium]